MDSPKRKPFVKIERDEIPRLQQLKWQAKVLFLHALTAGAFEPREEETAGFTVTLGHGQFLANDRDLTRELDFARNTLKAARDGLRVHGFLDWWPAVSSPRSKTLYQLVEPEKWIRWHGKPGSEAGSIVASRGSNGDTRNAGRGSNGDTRCGSNGDTRNAGRGSKNDEILIHGMIAPEVQDSRVLSLSPVLHEGKKDPEEAARPAATDPPAEVPTETALMVALLCEAAGIPMVERGEDPIQDARSVPGWLEAWVTAIGDPQQQPQGGTWEEVVRSLQAEVGRSRWLQGKEGFPGISLRWLAAGRKAQDGAPEPWGRVRSVLDGEYRTWGGAKRSEPETRERALARRQVEQGQAAREAAQAAAERWAAEASAAPQPDPPPTAVLVLEPAVPVGAEPDLVPREDALRLFDGLKKSLSGFGRLPGGTGP